MKIGLISDTHSHLDDKVFQYFDKCDEIWHAGDIGNLEVADRLEAFKPLRAVWGNIDGHELRIRYPENMHWECEGKRIWMTHIGGSKPPAYNPSIRKSLDIARPHLFICGHSHILRVMHDPKRPGLLYLNPGAAGKHGFHKVKTMLRFEMAEGRIFNMEVIELGSRGTLKT